MTLSEILQSNGYETSFETCPGCENHCTVKRFTFRNGNSFFSGNQCEKVYGSATGEAKSGVNMYLEKNRMLWNRRMTPEHQPTGSTSRGKIQTIGIPRGLGIYEDFPFWCTLLTECGFKVVLSKSSTNKLYEQGIRSIVADNICFPAKLFHGHVYDLIAKRVDRILYPWAVYEMKEDKASRNSYNCPIVSGYSDVIRSSIDTAANHGIPFDSPVVSFNDEKLLRRSCVQYLTSLGITRSAAGCAVEKAAREQQRYLDTLERRCQEVLERAVAEGRRVILLAGRPYHIDPLIEHKVSQAIASMGIDVITENVAASCCPEVYANINALSQWAYPNRIFKAAWFTAHHPYAGLHIVELTSFGCGPDAFILDETRAILDRFGKNLTVLKIDDVNNIGSLRLRIRSLVDSVKLAADGPQATRPAASVQSLRGGTLPPKADNQPFTTKPFLPEDRCRTIIAPYFAEGYSEYLPTVFRLMGYKLECLPIGCLDDAEQGLKEANNDICYPATIVVGSIVRALKSGRYDLDNTAVGITQTGGQCRASNYYSLIKNAMVKEGFAKVPVISVALGKGMQNTQPGFAIPWRKVWRPVVYTILFADAMQKLYYPAVAREKEKGAAKRIYDKYTAEAQPLIATHNYRQLMALLGQAVEDFRNLSDMERNPQRVGLVGEIYVKYNSFSNKNVVHWLVDKGVEVVPPALCGFFLTKLPNVTVNRRLNIQEPGMPDSVARLINQSFMRLAAKFDKICQPFTPYRPFTDIFENYRLASEVINPAANFGEGWFLTGEICHLVESGIEKVVSVQPFGCIANHIISKGVERRLKLRYPNLSLLFLDFDSGTSEANVQNRLHFMLGQ